MIFASLKLKLHSSNKVQSLPIQKSSRVDVQRNDRENRVWSHYHKHSQSHIVLHCFRSLLFYHQHEVEVAGQQDSNRRRADRTNNVEHNLDVIDSHCYSHNHRVDQQSVHSKVKLCLLFLYLDLFLLDIRTDVFDFIALPQL